MSFFDSTDFKTIAVIIVGDLVLGVLVAIKFLHYDIFFWANIVAFAYVLFKWLVPFILIRFLKKPLLARANEFVYWQKVKEHFIENRLPFGYPDYYSPENTLIIPSLNLFLVEVSRADLKYLNERLGYVFDEQDLENVEWQGTVVYATDKEAVTGRLRNVFFRDAIKMVESKPSTFSDKVGEAVRIPSFLQERTVSFA